VLYFVYSVLQSRGLERIKQDMDDSGQPLVARFGHCSQELVNLIITGQAVTNVFDGRKVLDGNPDAPDAYALKGIDTQQEIGFLTLLEALRLSKVGNNYKTPRSPIWVVGSTSHYTFIFALNRNVGQVSEKEQMDQKLRATFNELDPQEQGFIQPDQVQTLLNKLGLKHVTVEVAKKEMDPENVGLFLWPNVLHALDSLLSSPAWDCATCTFRNQGAVKVCEMCTTARPATASSSSATAKPKAEAKSPKEFTLYHFNGIDGHGKAVADCKRIGMTIIGDNVGGTIDTLKPGLREALQTKWPNAAIVYKDGEPKII